MNCYCQIIDSEWETLLFGSMDSLITKGLFCEIEKSDTGRVILCDTGQFLLGWQIPDYPVVLDLRQESENSFRLAAKYANGNTFLNVKLDSNLTEFCDDTAKAYYSDGSNYYWSVGSSCDDLKIVWGKRFYRNGNVELHYWVDENDKLISQGFYPDGQLESESFSNYEEAPRGFLWVPNESRLWHKNGQLLQVSTLNSGRSELRAWYENGNKLMEASFVDFDLFWVGTRTEYFENGNVSRVFQFKDGNTREEANIPHGTWYYYKENGEIEKIEEYKEGELISVRKGYEYIDE